MFTIFKKKLFSKTRTEILGEIFKLSLGLTEHPFSRFVPKNKNAGQLLDDCSISSQQTQKTKKTKNNSKLTPIISNHFPGQQILKKKLKKLEEVAKIALLALDKKTMTQAREHLRKVSLDEYQTKILHSLFRSFSRRATHGHLESDFVEV